MRSHSGRGQRLVWATGARAVTQSWVEVGRARLRGPKGRSELGSAGGVEGGLCLGQVEGWE